MTERTMTPRIYKYELKITDIQDLLLPEGAKIISVGMQIPHGEKKERLFLWAIVDRDQPLVARKIRVFGTGHKMYCEHELDFIGTVQMTTAPLVWHIFEDYIKE